MDWTQVLTGAAGEYLGGCAAAATLKLLGACSARIKKQFGGDARRRALERATARALHAMARGVAADPDTIRHYVEVFGRWMEREEVAEELSQVIDPRPEAPLNMKLLRDEFVEAGFEPRRLGEGVGFEACVLGFVEAFADAAAEEPELAVPIQIGLLRDLSANTRRLVHAGTEQAKDVKRIAERLDPDLTPFRKKYLERILDQCRDLPLGAIDPKSADATCGLDERMALAGVYIQLDTTETVRGTEKEPGIAPLGREERESKPLSALEALALHPRCVLLGQPGSGKSTFVNHLSLCLAGHRLEPKAGWIDRLPGWPSGWHGLIPVPVVLRELAAWIQDSQTRGTQTGLVMAYLRHWLSRMDLAEYYEDLRERLRSGQAILLLDGYDEVPQAEALRRTILAALEDLPRALAAPILLTCRVLGYQEPRWQLSRDTWRRFELSPLSPEKIRSFILAWYRQLAALMKVADPEKPARKLIHDVQRADLAPLAPNPLLLTVIAVVNGAKGEGLPDTRAKLYEEVVDLLLDRWDAGKFQAADGPAFGWRELIGEARLNDIDVKKTLWRVAYEAHLQAAGAQGGADAGAADIPEADLLRALSRLHTQGCLNWANKVIQLMKQRAGLLIESRPGIYRFPHRTFQEYLAGAHLGAELGFVETAAALGGGSGGWWVAIQLAIGRLVHVAGSTDRPLVLVSELCPQASSEEAGEADWRKVWLAGLCLLEVGPARAERLELGRRWAPQVRERLAALLTGGHLSPRERAEAGRALGALEDPRPGTGVRDGVPDIDWVGVAPGPFQMGSIKAQDPDAYKDELPQFPCILIGEPYRISRYPVTVAQYGEFMAAGGYSESRYWTEAGWAWRQKREIQGPAAYGPPFETPNHPRVGVSWYEAAAYCLWLSEKLDTKVELPSEAQWERAARHTDGRIYPWGNEFDPARCNMEDAGIGSTSAVGIFPSGAAESGAMDMSGNVLEWCRTEYRKNYEDYEAKVRDDLEGESARVLRGGAFGFNRHGVRCAFRYWSGPDYRIVSLGFRVVSPGL